MCARSWRAAWHDELARRTKLQEAFTKLSETAHPIAVWWSMVEAHLECSEKPLPEDDAVILHFMGSGASTTVTAGEIRALRTELNKQTKPPSPNS